MPKRPSGSLRSRQFRLRSGSERGSSTQYQTDRAVRHQSLEGSPPRGRRGTLSHHLGRIGRSRAACGGERNQGHNGHLDQAAARTWRGGFRIAGDGSAGRWHHLDLLVLIFLVPRAGPARGRCRCRFCGALLAQAFALIDVTERPVTCAMLRAVTLRQKDERRARRRSVDRSLSGTCPIGGDGFGVVERLQHRIGDVLRRSSPASEIRRSGLSWITGRGRAGAGCEA